MSVGSSKVTGREVTTTGEMVLVTIPTIKGDNSKAMINGVSKVITPTGHNKDHRKTGGIIMSHRKIVATITNRSKIGVITTSLRKGDREIPGPNKITIKITLTSKEATGPKTGHHSGLRKTGVVSNSRRREEMIQKFKKSILQNIITKARFMPGFCSVKDLF